MSSIDFLAALEASMPGIIMNCWGSGTGFILSSGPTGRSSAKSTHSQFKMRVCSFFGIAGSPSLTHTFACLLATSSACRNSKLIIEPAVTAAGVDVVAESIVADVICTAGTTVMLKGGSEGGQRFHWGHPSHCHCMGWGKGHTQGGLDKVQIACNIIIDF